MAEKEGLSPMSDSGPWIDLKEFRDKGYLLEANRQFFHPLGLALALAMDDDGDPVAVTGLYDYRDDPEGCIFAELDAYDAERAKEIEKLWREKAEVRKERFGWVIQPLDGSNDG